MVPRGDARDLLERLGRGVIAEPDPAHVERSIEHLPTVPAPDRPADLEGNRDCAVRARCLTDSTPQATESALRARETGESR